MKEIRTRTIFEKNLKKVCKYPKYKQSVLDSCLTTLAEGNTLDAKYKDHKLAKQSPIKYQECRCFHIAPNICVVYMLERDFIELVSIGSHQDLGLTEAVLYI